MAPAQQDGGLGGCRARRLQEHLEAAGLRPVQVVIENELAGAEHSQQRCHRAWAARAAPCDSHPLTEQLWGAEAWNSGLERTAGALGSDTDARKEPGEMAGLGRGGGRGGVSQGGAGRGGSPQGLTLCAVPGVVTAWPGGVPGAAGTVIPGPALRVVPQAEAHLKIGGYVVSWGTRGLRLSSGASCLGPPLPRPVLTAPALADISCLSPRGTVPRPAPCPTHCRGPHPHPNGPRSCPPRHTAGGAPRRPRSGSGGAPGGSVPGGLGAGLTHHPPQVPGRGH